MCAAQAVNPITMYLPRVSNDAFAKLYIIKDSWRVCTTG
jgi:hypothetical protein